MAPTLRIRPYKDFLTPALHRRFALATAILAGACYVEAVYIGEWYSFFWSWFPLGMVGIRTGLFFLCAFMIFVLRVAQLHVGLRTSDSGIETFTQYALRFQTLQTTLWYMFSAWFFSEIYIWSVPESADLNRIKSVTNDGRLKTGRPVLNEKPIYLTSYLFFLAMFQAGWHLYYDYDRIEIPIKKMKPKSPPGQETNIIVPPMAQLKAKMNPLAWSSLIRVIVVAFVSPFIYALDIPLPPFLTIYTLNVRRFAWSFTRSWAKIFWNLPKSASPPAVHPFHWSMILRTVVSGFMLMMLWEIGNAAFTIYVAQEPLKKDRPVTYESRDPNGSLLTGLNGVKLQTRAFAFWELVLISQNYEGRRKAIFEDIDRAGGSAWSQILKACLETIEAINTRIDTYDPEKKPPVIDVYEAEPYPEPISSLPRLTEPLKEQPNGGLASSPPATGKTRYIEAAGDFVKRQGQSSARDVRSRSYSQQAEKTRAAIAAALPEQFKQPEGGMGIFHEHLAAFLRTRFGSHFRKDYRRIMARVVLGGPYGDVGVIVDAIDSMCRLAVCSLTEDKYGNVQRDIKTIIVTLTKTIERLQTFRTKIDTHWTDVERRRDSPEVDVIVASLKGGLSDILEAFGEFAPALKLTRTELRLAREAAGTEAVL